MSDWKVLADGHVVEARSQSRLGFERPEQREFRAELAAAHAALAPDPVAALHAVYAHADAGHEPVDLENVLTYNVDAAALRPHTGAGIVLERSFHVTPDPRFPADLGHAMTWRLTRDPGWSRWRAGTPLAGVRLPGLVVLRAATAQGVWAAARRAGVTVHRATHAVPDRVAVDVTVTTPSAVRIGLLGVLKPLVDGLLAALHGYSGTHREELLTLLAGTTDATPAEAEQWLGWGPNPLGNTAFVIPRAGAVQISPADDRVVALRLQRVVGPDAGITCAVSEAESQPG